jgi:hypothetical protein
VLDLHGPYGNAFVSRLLRGGPIQRKCGCGGSCCSPPAEKLGDTIQRKPGGGSPLPVSTRSAMEASFGRNFGGVRVHAGPRAESLASGIGARAFTSGHDIYFGRGQYEPASPSGQGLIAHELAHVVQQRSGRSPAAGIDTPGDAYEREADAAAEAVLSGRRPRVSPIGGAPGVQRKSVRGVECEPVGTFNVPPEKGDSPEVKKGYTGMEKPMVTRTQQTRSDDTETLRKAWMGKQKSLIKDPKAFKWPVDNEGKACTVDHTVEWVLHGASSKSSERPENMMLMAGRRNSGAGARVGDQIAKARQKRGISEQKEICFGAPGYPSVMGPDECMLIDLALDKYLEGKVGKGDVFILKVGRGEIPVDLNGIEPKGGIYTVKEQKILLRGKEAKIAKGLLIQELTIQPNNQGGLAAEGSGRGLISSKWAWPFTGTETPVDLKVSTDGRLKLDKRKYKARFPGLSEADFDVQTDANDEFVGEAKFTPSKPILNKTIIHVVVREGELSAKVQVPIQQINLPIPGLTLSGEGLILGFERGELFASGQVVLQYSTIARGEIKALATKEGFTASGQIDLTIPGLDKATGKVWLDKEGEVGGRIDIGAEKLKVPGVKRASLTVLIQKGALAGEGTLDLAVPGVKQARLGFGVDEKGNYAINGEALLSIPGTEDPRVGLTYKNGDIEGYARVGLKIPGLESAVVEVRYAKGAVTGSGTVSYKKGKLAGTVTVALSERGKLSGGGELSYEIAPGLVAFVGMQIREDGTTKVSGGLRVPETVDVFPRKEIEKGLFKLPTLEIPIFAIPLGTRSAGLVATINARIVARAGIGPGQLRKVKVLADFDPSAAEGAFSFQASAELYVPANAELGVAIAAGLGLSVAIARAVGGIEAEGAAGLQAEFIAGTALKYEKGQFAIAGAAELSAMPKLVFRLKAFVKVEVDVFVTTIEVYRKDWLLAQKEVGSSLRIGVRVPFKYVFGQPFELSLDQIEFIVPKIEPGQLVKELLPA